MTMIWKEARAVLPAAIVCAAAILAARWAGTWLTDLALMAYVVGAAVVGALGFGHEFTHRTLSTLLAQPLSRHRIFLTKMAVLLAVLLALRAFAVLAPIGRVSPVFVNAVLWLPVALALCVTPWFTLMARTPVAGAVFTLALPGIVLVAAQSIGVRRYGFTSEVDAFRIAFLWWTLLSLSAIGLVMAWRTFVRLQATDGRGSHVAVIGPAAPRGEAARVRTNRHPVLRLLGKELHLQQLTLVVTLFYTAGYVITAMFSGPLRQLEDELLGLTLFYAGMVALMVGSLASAEERHLGTLQWQLLLPMSSLKQWTIKVATTLTLAIVLGVVVPATLAYFMPPDRWGPWIVWQYFNKATIPLLVLLTCGGLYVSSVASSGVWALISAFAGLVSVGVLLSLVRMFSMRIVPYGVLRRGDFPDALHLSRYSFEIAFMLLLAAGMLMLLRMALANHRSAERDPRRTATQVACIAAGVVFLASFTILAGI